MISPKLMLLLTVPKNLEPPRENMLDFKSGSSALDEYMILALPEHASTCLPLNVKPLKQVLSDLLSGTGLTDAVAEPSLQS